MISSDELQRAKSDKIKIIMGSLEDKSIRAGNYECPDIFQSSKTSLNIWRYFVVRRSSIREVNGRFDISMVKFISMSEGPQFCRFDLGIFILVNTVALVCIKMFVVGAYCASPWMRYLSWESRHPIATRPIVV